MVFVGVRYGTNPQMMTTEGVGGSPYGPSTMPRENNDETEAPVAAERTTAQNLGRRVAQVVAQLRAMPEEDEDAETVTV